MLNPVLRMSDERHEDIGKPKTVSHACSCAQVRRETTMGAWFADICFLHARREVHRELIDHAPCCASCTLLHSGRRSALCSCRGSVSKCTAEQVSIFSRQQLEKMKKKRVDILHAELFSNSPKCAEEKKL